MKPILSCILFLVFLSAGLQAKENKDLIRANYYYRQLAFHEAIPFYEKIADELSDPAIFAQLADCYRLTGNLPKAADWYAKSVAKEGHKDATVLHYAQVLMQLARYDDAKKWLTEYATKNQGDVRVSNLIAGCDAAKKKDGIPGGIVSMLELNTDGSEFGPTLWSGQLIFSSDTAIGVKKKTDRWSGNAYFNIYSVPCGEKGQCGTTFSEVATGKDLNIKYHDGPCTFTADGKQMYFTRSRFNNTFFSKKSIANKDSLVLLEIMIASDYDKEKKAFKTIEPFAYNSKEYSVAHPTVSPNGNLLVFSSNMPKGTGGSDLYICTRRKTKDWAKPVNIGKVLNTEGEELFPYWADDNTLYFSSDGHKGLGGLDIYKATYDESTKEFSEPENIAAPINSSYDEISLALFADGRSSYFSSNRPAVKGGDNLYYYKKRKIFLRLDVSDSLTQQPVAGAGISVSATSDKKDRTTDNNGRMTMQLYPEELYGIGVSKGDYIPQRLTVSAVSQEEVDTIVRVVKLARVPVPPKQVMAPIEPGEVPFRNKNVMDPPGIQNFELDEVYEVGHFYYDYNKFDLKVVHKRFLDTLMIQMNRHPTMRIEIRAHTDCRGSVASNQVLSVNRALSVVNYLVEHGIPRNRMEHKGMGSTSPAIKCPTCSQCTEEEHHLNRLLEFRVLQL